MFPIFEKLGGEKAALTLLRRDAGVETTSLWPTHWAVAKWVLAGEIPGSVVIRFLRICERRGISVSYRDFVWQERKEAA